MTVSPKKYQWEDWQLTAYLLGELEPELAAQIEAAAKTDQALAQQLGELSKTLDEVKAVFSHDGTAAGDQAALSALTASVTGNAQAVQPQSVARGFTLRRLVTRWENWASLAGLILIGVLLYQRPGGQVVATSGPAPETEEAKVRRLTGEIQAEREKLKDVTGGRRRTANNQPASALADESGLSAPIVDDVADIALGTQPAPSYAPPAAASVDTSPVKNRPEVAPTTGPTNAPASPTLSLAAGVANESSAPGQMGGRGGMPLAAGMGGMSSGANMGGSAGGMGGGMGGMMGGTDGTLAQARPMPGGMGMGGMMGGMGEGRGYASGMGSMDGLGYVDESEVRQRGMGMRPHDPQSGDRFAAFSDNEFQKVEAQPLSTFSIDVDTAAYTKARQYLLEQRQLPPPAAVRIEEFINYFDYEYAGPQDDKPFAASLAVTQCPWQPKHQLVRIALQAKQVENADRPKANLVFLLDVSGSMDSPNKLPLVKETIRLLTYQLGENDKVAMVVYAGAAGCVLESTHGHQQDKILSAIERLNAGGSTNGGQGIQLAYKMARENFIPGGINRVILCTDGDFNVGVTSTNDLVEMVKEQARSNVFLTVLGYGVGNTNDAMMEQIADRGNGLYGFVDSRREAQRQMVKQLAGNLMTVAKDVKIQVEFNPGKVRSYRLIGYENRQLAAEDFNNDKKDAGEIGAGHRVTALYELVPINETTQEPLIDGLRYQATKRPAEVAPVKLDDGAVSNELLAVKLRYKQPEGSESQLLTFPLEDKSVAYAELDKDFRWSAAMAEFGMLLRRSPHKGQATWSSLTERARAAIGNPVDLNRAEALEMIGAASNLSGGR